MIDLAAPPQTPFPTFFLESLVKMSQEFPFLNRLTRDMTPMDHEDHIDRQKQTTLLAGSPHAYRSHLGGKR